MKKLTIITIVLLIIIMIPISSFAETVINVDEYKPSSPTSNTSVNRIVNVILGAVRAVGSIIAVGSLMLMGIKYMAGSIEEKAEYKKTMIPYFIGIILLFAGVNIVAMVYNVVQKSIN